MVNNVHWTPLPIQIVTDLGQLTAFGHPDMSRIIRVLQRQEASANGLSRILDIPESTLTAHLQRLTDLVLVRVVGTSEGDDGPEDMYRATAKMFNLKPDPRELGLVATPMAVAMLDTLSREILSSVEAWPDQTMYCEARRARIPVNRALEFNDRMVELLREFWGDDVEPVEENPELPLLSFAGVWYRVPE